MPRSIVGVLAPLVLLSSTGHARADGTTAQRSAWEERPLAIEAHLGIATPSGLVGLGVDVSPFDRWSFDCRGGTNIYGVEAGCGARLRVAQAQTRATYVGLGLSLGPTVQAVGTRYGLFSVIHGPLTQMSHRTYSVRRWSTAYWTNLELGHESRAASGFVFRAYLGIAVLLNPGDGRLDALDSVDEVLPASHVLPYGGLAFGWSL